MTTKNKILLSKNALDDLRKLEKKIQQRIITKLDYFNETDSPLQYAIKLKCPQFGEYRFRIGNYRIFFDLDTVKTTRIINILAIKHRKEAYLD